MSSKTKGPLLTSVEDGDLGAIPGEFRAASQLTTKDEGVPNDTPLPPSGDYVGIIESKHIDRQTPELKERVVKLTNIVGPFLDIDSGGSGYTSAPTVVFDSGTATAVATIGFVVASLGLLSSGTGYLYPPIVDVRGGGGFGCVVLAVLSLSGHISHFNIINPGQGFTSIPTVTLIGGGASAPGSANAILSTTGSVVGLTLTNPGTYNVAPNVSFTGGGGSGATATYSLSKVGWPTMLDFYTDPVEGIVVDLVKTIVPAGTPYPGGFVEERQLDKWRSLQITSKVDLRTLPGSEIYTISTDLRLPDLLLEVGVGWSDSSSASANEQSNVSGDRGGASALAEVSTSSDGTVFTRVLGGFRGAVLATLIRSYYFGPPQITFTPTLIIPATGTANVVSRAASASLGQGTESDSNSNSESTRVHVATIGPILTGNFKVTNASHTSPPVAAVAEAEDDDGTIFSVTALSNGALSTLTVNMPVSIPTQFFPNQVILSAVNVQKWRFDIFIQELIYAILPANLPTTG